MTDPRRLRILVVDDNRSAADALGLVLRKGGDEVESVYDGVAAIDRIKTDPPDVVLTDLRMSPVDGMEVLQAARDQRPPVETLVFTAFGDIEIAVNAMRMGARDFLTKPVTVEQVLSRLDQIRTGVSGPHPDDSSEPLIAESPASQLLMEAIEAAASVPSRLWIEGEIGSGRVFCAQKIHALAHADEPFHIRDLGQDGAWPEHGTVVLPNVDDLADDLQRRLYRRLQYVPQQIRVIATAGPNGRRRIAEGTLRPELYYALAVVVVSVPPLRQRPTDIAPLFEQALTRFAGRYNRAVPDIDPDRLAELERHAWPGNIRELLNLAEHHVVMGNDDASLTVVERSSAGLPNLEPGFNLSGYLETVERQILVEALRICGGDRAEAGRLLGVERNTLRYKLNKYKLLDK